MTARIYDLGEERERRRRYPDIPLWAVAAIVCIQPLCMATLLVWGLVDAIWSATGGDS